MDNRYFDAAGAGEELDEEVDLSGPELFLSELDLSEPDDALDDVSDFADFSDFCDVSDLSDFSDEDELDDSPLADLEALDAASRLSVR